MQADPDKRYTRCQIDDNEDPGYSDEPSGKLSATALRHLHEATNVMFAITYRGEANKAPVVKIHKNVCGLSVD